MFCNYTHTSSVQLTWSSNYDGVHCLCTQNDSRCDSGLHDWQRQLCIPAITITIITINIFQNDIKISTLSNCIKIHTCACSQYVVHIFHFLSARFLKMTWTYPKKSEDFQRHSEDFMKTLWTCSSPSPKNDATARVLFTRKLEELEQVSCHLYDWAFLFLHTCRFLKVYIFFETKYCNSSNCLIGRVGKSVCKHE